MELLCRMDWWSPRSFPNLSLRPRPKPNRALREYSQEAEKVCAPGLAAKARELSIALYTFAAEYAAKRNIILADTKFEFGTLPDGELILIDETLTPDSSRYWLAEHYRPGQAQINFDKQVLVWRLLEGLTLE